MYHIFKHWSWTTKRRIERSVLPLRDTSIRRAKKTQGMSEAEYKEAIRKVRRKREADASRIAAELDRRGIISDVSTAQFLAAAFLRVD